VDVTAPPPLAEENLRVLLVASDPVVRRALSTNLRARFEAPEVTVASSMPDVMPDVDLTLWDLGADAIGLIERLQTTTLPAAPVVALIPTGEHARDALTWGARGVLPRDADDDLLVSALRAASRGLTVIAPTFLDALLNAEAREPAPTPTPSGESLTTREREVLGHIAEGLSNKLIAHQLGISEHTVKFHVNAVMARLGAQSRTEAVVTAARRGLLVL
jgi:two-component system, NarL family, nitrate/nitrite response regulator NarL